MASPARAFGSPVPAWRLMWRPLAPGEVDHERVWTYVFLIGAGLALAVPETVRLSLICPLKALVGVPCLTCGSNRALSAMLQLEPLRALAWNPLVCVIGAAWAVYATYATIVVVARLPRLRLRSMGDLGRLRWLGIGLAIVAVTGNWLYLYMAGI
jgi:hypothetical protein